MAAREKVADKNVATTELAAVLGISARRVQQLAQDGILDTVERGKFELGAAVQAYIRFLGRDAMTEEEQIALLATDGMLVKRPLLVGEDFVLPGFKPADWEKALL